MVKLAAVVSRYALLLLCPVLVESQVSASSPKVVHNDSDSKTVNCSALCRGWLPEIPTTHDCERACDILEADEACGKAVLTSSPEHLLLMSYSSGHISEAAAIEFDAADSSNATKNNETAEIRAFIGGLHMKDLGSPDGCAALENTHYCLAMGLVVGVPPFLGLCLPRTCDSASLSGLFANITASPGDWDDESNDESDEVSDEVFFFCEDERPLSVDTGALVMLSTIGILTVLTLVGTALEHARVVRRRCRCRTLDMSLDEGNNVAVGKKQNETQHSAHGDRLVPDHHMASSARKTTTDREDRELDDSDALETSVDDLEESSSMATVRLRGGKEHDTEDEMEGDVAVGGEGSYNEEDRLSAHYGGSQEDEISGREPLLSPRPTSSLQQQWPLSNVRRTAAGDGNNTFLEVDVNWWWACLECFSLRRNVQKLIAPPREGNEFGALDGVRTLSMLWVLLGHVFEALATGGAGITNVMDLLPVHGHGLLARFSGQTITGGVFAVDSFFLISGFLLSSMLLPKLNSGSLRGRRWKLQVYLHRYLRLTPTIAFVTFFVWKVLPLLGSGAIWWSQTDMLLDSCRSGWWADLFFLANFGSSCLGVTWYLGNDMQFFLVGVPLVSLFHHRHRIGIATVAALGISSCVYTLWLGFSSDIRFSLFEQNSVAMMAYAAPWTRCPVYLIGMLSGFVWHTGFRSRKCTRTRTHGNNGDRDDIPSNKAVDFLYRHRVIVIPATAAVSALLMALPVYGAYWSYQDMRETSVPAWANHLYLAFSRPSWALGLALMCGLCFCGNGGWVNWLLTGPTWAILSRLTFCTYLIHPPLLMVLYGSRSVAPRFTELDLSVSYIGLVVATFAGAAAVHLLVEAPFRNLEGWAKQRGGEQ